MRLLKNIQSLIIQPIISISIIPLILFFIITITLDRDYLISFLFSEIVILIIFIPKYKEGLKKTYARAEKRFGKNVDFYKDYKIIHGEYNYKRYEYDYLFIKKETNEDIFIFDKTEGRYIDIPKNKTDEETLNFIREKIKLKNKR